MKRRRGVIGRRVLHFRSLLDEGVLFADPGGCLSKSQFLEFFKSCHQEKRDIRVCFWEQFFMSGPKFFTAYQFAATEVRSGKRQAIGTSVAGELRNGKVVLGATS
jgi:hypothetical protein